MEPGDGELVISPVVQPIIELESPINVVRVGATTDQSDDSFYTSFQDPILGVGVSTTNTIAIFTKGAWILEISGVVFFTGTNSAVNSSGLILEDPDVNQAYVFQAFHITTLQFAIARVLHLVFQRDGFKLRTARGVTVAGDALTVGAQVNARRIL
jgi:hypothetical protein